MGQYFRALIKNKKGRDMVYHTRDGEKTPAKLTEHSWWYNPFVSAVCNAIYMKPSHVAWVGDYAKTDNINVFQNTLYRLAWKREPVAIEGPMLVLDTQYLVNHSKKIYLDCDKYKNDNLVDDFVCYHPLPLLTAVGNGEGGGDYYGINREDIGTWAWDVISVENNAPKGFDEVEYVFKEEFN